MVMASPQRVLPPPVPHPTLIPKSLSSSQGIIEHPNGSDGWLPAENFNLPPNQEERSTPKRKSAFRTSRHTTTEPRSALVNGTPPAVAAPMPDEELQNRVVLLTPKQRSRIEKSEG